MPFFRGVRTSKYRHVYGSASRKDKCYENIKITRNAHDSNFCAVNPKFMAVVTETAGGGSFLVLPLNKMGRIEVNMPKVTGHRGAVLDIKWDPFDDNVIASCSEDTTIKVWYIPDSGLVDNITQSLVTLRGHQRRIGFVEWHPTASNILASAGYDYKAIIWNVETAEAVTYIDCHKDTIYSLSFNRDGSLLATTCKDKKLRILDPRSGELIKQTQSHQGTKSSKCVFLGNTGKIATTGFSRMCERQFAVWDAADLSKPERIDNIDSGSGTLLPYFDSDNNVMFLAGKGDGNIRYYEIVSDGTGFHYLSEYKSASPQRGLGSMPKRGLDFSRCEIMRFFKLHSVAGIVEPVGMIVPRKSDMFQDDIYPDTPSPEPSLSAKEWLSGIDRDPILMSVRDNNKVFTPPSAADFRPGGLENGRIENTETPEVRPAIDAGYYRQTSKKDEKKEQTSVRSPPQQPQADAGFYRSKSTDEPTSPREEKVDTGFRRKQFSLKEDRTDTRFTQKQSPDDHGDYRFQRRQFSPTERRKNNRFGRAPSDEKEDVSLYGKPFPTTDNRVDTDVSDMQNFLGEEKPKLVKVQLAEVKTYQGSRKLWGEEPELVSPTRNVTREEVVEVTEKTDTVQLEQVPQFVANEDPVKITSPDNLRRTKWRHSQPVTTDEVVSAETSIHKQPSPERQKKRSPERFIRRPRKVHEDGEVDDGVFDESPENKNEKLKSVHERRQSFEPENQRQSRNREIKRTQSDDFENRSQEAFAGDGRKVQVLEGATRKTVIISQSDEMPDESSLRRSPSPTLQTSPPVSRSTTSDNDVMAGSGSYVSRTRSTLISKFGGTTKQPTEQSSIRKTESDLMNMDELRKAYLRQQDEIRRLRGEVASKDMRIRHLEAELSNLRQ
ncbi:uncharacterized protein LOC144449917 isoform X2 [Glandiceps talaboti]